MAERRHNVTLLWWREECKSTTSRVLWAKGPGAWQLVTCNIINTFTSLTFRRKNVFFDDDMWGCMSRGAEGMKCEEMQEELQRSRPPAHVARQQTPKVDAKKDTRRGASNTRSETWGSSRDWQHRGVMYEKCHGSDNTDFVHKKCETAHKAGKSNQNLSRSSCLLIYWHRPVPVTNSFIPCSHGGYSTASPWGFGSTPLYGQKRNPLITFISKKITRGNFVCGDIKVRFMKKEDFPPTQYLMISEKQIYQYTIYYNLTLIEERHERFKIK